MFPKRALLVATLAALTVTGAPAFAAGADTPPIDELADAAPPEADEAEAGIGAEAPESDATPPTDAGPAPSPTPPDLSSTAAATATTAETGDPAPGDDQTPAVPGDAAEVSDTTVPAEVPDPTVESAPLATDGPAQSDVITPSPPVEPGPPVDAAPPEPLPDATVPTLPEPIVPVPPVDPPSTVSGPAPPAEASPSSMPPGPDATVSDPAPEPPLPPVIAEPLPAPIEAPAAAIPAAPSDVVASDPVSEETVSPATTEPAAPDHTADIDDPVSIAAEPSPAASTPDVVDVDDVEPPVLDAPKAKTTGEADAGRVSGQPPSSPFPTTGRALPATWVSGSVIGPDGSPGDGSLQLTFPVLGPVRYSDGWGNPRGDHGERRHEGTDLLGVAGQPLRAVFDGVVTRYQLEDRGISGAIVTITRDDGLRANYFHINTADLATGRRDAAPASWRIPTAVQLGSRVAAGQIIGFMGDSGNATGVPHLHFELRTPDGIPFNPYPALAAAEDRERCTAVFGSWANVGAVPDVPVLPVVEVDGPGGAIWQLTARGEVVAINTAAATVGDGCDRTRLVP